MEDDEGGLPKLSKRFADKGGEVDYKTTSGTAWSHSYLNQKPWHPLSYPNQRRKWIAEQTHAQRERRLEEVTREYTQEQEFLRQTSLLSQKDKEKVDIMQAVSFMYVRPPGYNAESAKAAETVDEKRRVDETGSDAATSSAAPQDAAAVKHEKKKSRPKDVFGRSLPTEEEFAVLKNAPRLETGVAGRAKPFAVEVRNVKCVRCGTFGHQSGDRECPLKDVLMPNEESRLKREDPLTAIMAQVGPSEPLNWELKQKPGITPPRGGFQPDDPNQQIVAEEIFDEYGGFLNGGIIPELLSNFSSEKRKKKTRSKSKHKKRSSQRHSHDDGSSDSDDDLRSLKTKSKNKQKESSSRPRKGDDYTSDSDNCRKSSKTKFKSKRRHKRQGYVTDSDLDGSFDSDDDLRGPGTKSKIKRGGTISKSKQKEAATRPRKQADYSSDSDGGQRSSKTMLKSKYRRKKQGSVKDSEEDGSSDSEEDGSSDSDDHLRTPKTKSKSKQKEASSRPRKEGDGHLSDSDAGRRGSKTKFKSGDRHRRRGSVDGSYEDRSSDSDDDLRSRKTKGKSKQKEASTRPRKVADGYSSGSDDGRWTSKTKSKSDRSHRKRPLAADSDDDGRSLNYSRSRKEHIDKNSKNERYVSRYSMSDGSADERYVPRYSMSDGSADERYQRASLIEIERDRKSDDYRRRSREERAHKSDKRLSQFRMSEGLEDERCPAKRRHNSYQGDHVDSVKHRTCHSPICSEMKKPFVDDFPDGEKKSRREGKRDRKHLDTRSDSECSSSENLETDRHRQKHRHR